MNGKNGFVMIEMMLSLAIMMMIIELTFTAVDTKRRYQQLQVDEDEVYQLWQNEERCEVFCPKKDLLPDLISLK